MRSGFNSPTAHVYCSVPVRIHCFFCLLRTRLALFIMGCLDLWLVSSAVGARFDLVSTLVVTEFLLASFPARVVDGTSVMWASFGVRFDLVWGSSQRRVFVCAWLRASSSLARLDVGYSWFKARVELVGHLVWRSFVGGRDTLATG